jgi:hypothetical protein
MSAQRFEEVEAQSPRDAWLMRVNIKKFDSSPGGTERVVGTQKFNYRLGADNETADTRESRLRVKRKARQRSMDMFDPAKHEATKAKRRIGSKAAAVTASCGSVGGPAGPDRSSSLEQRAEGNGPAPAAACVQGPLGGLAQLDWAILRLFKALHEPGAVLEALRATGPIPADMTVETVRVRYETLCECVQVTAHLVGTERSLANMLALRDLCM